MSQPTVHQQVIRELYWADAQSSAIKRFAGLATLLAMGLWIAWTFWASNYMGKALIQVNIGLLMSQHYQDQSPAPTNNPTPDSAPPITSTMTPQERQQALEQWRNRRQATSSPTPQVQKTLNPMQQIRYFQNVQGWTLAGWWLVMILTAAFMLCAAVSALTGSPASRKWHALLVYCKFAAALATTGGILILSRWGGFPSPDYSVLAMIAGAQCAYAVLIVIALLATHRSTSDWLHKLS